MGTISQNPLQKLLSNFQTVTYKKGQVILFQGEAPRDAFIIKKGVVKVYNLDNEGREQLIYFKSDYDVFPFTWIMGKSLSTMYFYEAFEDCEIYRLPRERYVDLLKTDKALMLHSLEMQADFDRIKSMRLNAVIHSKASDKLIHTIYYLVHSNSRQPKGNIATISIQLTQQDLANLTGLTRETTSVELGRLKKSGVIIYKVGELYKVNTVKLQRLLNDKFIEKLH